MEEEGIFRLYVNVWYELPTRRIFSGFRSVWIKLRSCKTRSIVSDKLGYRTGELTGNACEELSGKALNLTARKWYKSIAFQKIEHTLAEKIGNNTYVVSEVEAISKVYTLITIVSVVV